MSQVIWRLLVSASLSWWCCDSAAEELDSPPRRASDLFLLSVMTLSKWFPFSWCQAAALLPQWRLIGVCACVQVCVLALLVRLLISTNCSFILSRSLHPLLHIDPQCQARTKALLNWNIDEFWSDLLIRSCLHQPCQNCVDKRWLLCHNSLLHVNCVQ